MVPMEEIFACSKKLDKERELFLPNTDNFLAFFSKSDP